MARMAREDWLALGLASLAETGPAALTVEALTNRAGRTRGSFYHHFDDREDFVDGVLNLWRRQTADIAASPGATLADLDLALERGVRKMAGAGSVVGAVDAERVSRLRETHADPESPAATDYAQIAYAVFLGLLADPSVDAARTRALLRLTRDMIGAHWNE